MRLSSGWIHNAKVSFMISMSGEHDLCAACSKRGLTAMLRSSDSTRAVKVIDTIEINCLSKSRLPSTIITPPTPKERWVIDFSNLFLSVVFSATFVERRRQSGKRARQRF